MSLIGLQDGGKIRRLREQRGMNVPAFARAIGIASQHLSNVECNNKGASLDVLIRIARGLGVKVDDLLREDSDEDALAVAPVGIRPGAKCTRCGATWSLRHVCADGSQRRAA